MAASNVLGRLSVVTSVRQKSGKSVPVASSTRRRLDFAESDDLTIDANLRLPNDGAAEYIRNLTPVTRLLFDGLTSQYKKLAFTLAGTADTRLIEKVRDELAEAARDGSTSGTFQAAIDRITSAEGVEKLNAFTLDTAFNTAMARAHSAGRYEQLQDTTTKAILPYWQYMTVGDGRVRPEHAILDGFQALADDPVWLKIYPPNGFNCRCIVIGLLMSEVSDEARAGGGLERLPMLARLKVPQAGFEKSF